MWATGKYFILGSSYQGTDLSIEIEAGCVPVQDYVSKE